MTQANGRLLTHAEPEAKVKESGSGLEEALQRPMRPIIEIEGGRMVPKNFEGVQRIAMWLLATGLMPKWVNDTAKAILVVSICNTLGLDPVLNARFVMVVNGVPSIWGDALVAKARGSGFCAGIREWYTGKPGTDDYTAHVEAKRFIKDPAGGFIVEPCEKSFSWAEAKQAGLLGKDLWVKFPQRMLLGKPRAYVLRQLFADVLCGVDVYEDVADRDASPDRTSPLDARVENLSIETPSPTEDHPASVDASPPADPPKEPAPAKTATRKTTKAAPDADPDGFVQSLGLTE